MTKYIFMLLCVLIGSYFIASAPIEKHSWLIGGNGSVNFIRDHHFQQNQNAFYNQFEASLSPNIGFFVFNNFAVGTRIPLSITAATDYNSHSIGVGPFVRYYFGKGSVKLFPEVKIEFNRSAYKSVNPFTMEEWNDINSIKKIAAGLGVTYFIASNFALEGILYFYVVEGTDTYEFTHYIIDRQGISFNIGFQFYLPYKQ